MKVYEGERNLGGAVVTVDGQALAPRLDLKPFSKIGFEWGFVGPGPQQLALALLADHLGDDAEALRLSDGVMRRLIALLDNAWRLDPTDLDATIAECT